MDPEQFTNLIAGITSRIAGRSLDRALEADLNAIYAPSSAVFSEVQDACRVGIAEGWMCNREANGIRYGRVLKAGAATHGFSVDVVEMGDVVGPHHRHPNGEIDLVMPQQDGALFDGRGAGWMVYEPGSAHRPTVSGGKALVLYLLPEGAIEFAKADNA